MPELSDPSVQAVVLERLAELRSKAAGQLTGTAANKGPAARAIDALSVLHAMASSPETASDALTLLHELQVHQVEIDVQAQELRDSRAELESALQRQIELYDGLPVGCYTVDRRTHLHELNRTGAELLGVGRDDAHGLPLDAFLGGESAHRFRSAMDSIDAGEPQACCLLTLQPKQGPQRPVLASIGKDTEANRYLVSLAATGSELTHPSSEP